MIIDRGREAVVLGGREVRPAGNINLLSMQLKILLKSGNISFIHASTNRSQIAMQSTSTNVRIFFSINSTFFFFFFVDRWIDWENRSTKTEIILMDLLKSIPSTKMNSISAIIL